MKQKFVQLLLLAQFLFAPKLFSQNIAINTTGNQPDTSAMLDISSTNLGFLMPRMNTTQVNTIVLPATGLLVFNTDINAFQVNIGTTTSPIWNTIGTSQSGWSINGNTGINSNNFLGTTDGKPLTFKVNNLLSGFIDTLSGNTLFGYLAGIANTTGYDNTFIGSLAGQHDSSGSFNTAVGQTAGYALTSGSGNSFFGINSGVNATTGNYNTAIGYRALYGGSPFTGSNNVGIGSGAGVFLTAGSNNTLIGPNAGYTLNTGSNNIVLGNWALSYGDTASENVAIGNNAGTYAVSDSNIFIGNNAGYQTSPGTGIFIGNNAGMSNYSGTNLLLLGNYSDVTTDGLNNATAIGYGATVGANNSLVLGGTGTNAVDVGIGTSTPNSTLQIAGSVSANITTQNTDYTVSSSDFTIITTQSNTTTITLPDPTTCIGRLIYIENYGSTTVTLSTPTGNINSKPNSNAGSYTSTTTLSLGFIAPSVNVSTLGNVYYSANGYAATLQSDGNNWWVISSL
jgi:hypothetical protein